MRGPLIPERTGRIDGNVVSDNAPVIVLTQEMREHPITVSRRSVLIAPGFRWQLFARHAWWNPYAMNRMEAPIR